MVVEDAATALREAGEVVAAVAAGVLTPDALVGLADLACGRAAVDRSRPRVFKCVGMAWEDRVVAAPVFGHAGYRRSGVGEPEQRPDGAVAAARRRLRTSLRQQVTEALRGALITGAMLPGALYSAPTLAAMLGVSATPVREAMLDLAKEGLVEAVRNKGFRVTELTDAELDDITELRMLIEVPTVAGIAADYAGDPAGRMETLRAEAREIVRHAEAGDLIAYVRADRLFHLDLLALAGNAQLVAVIADLRSRSRLYGLQQLVDSGRLGRVGAGARAVAGPGAGARRGRCRRVDGPAHRARAGRVGRPARLIGQPKDFAAKVSHWAGSPV